MAERGWICLDIGETLIDETRVWTTWAGVLGVTPLVLMATLGAEVAAGRSYGAALERLSDDWQDRHPDYDTAFGAFRAEDLYRDAIPGIAAMQAAGFGVAVIGNQPARRTAELTALGVDPDVMAMSDEIGYDKPDASFFAAALGVMGGPSPSSVTYVGDRVDNDIIAATSAGLRAIHLRRGPWGILGPQADGRALGVADDLQAVLALLT